MKIYKGNQREGVNLLCGLKDGFPIRVYRFIGTKGRAIDDLHYHPKSPEYYYVLKGRITLSVGEKTVDLRENELLCVEAGEVHVVLSVEEKADVVIIRNEFAENDKVSVDNKKWSINN